MLAPCTHRHPRVQQETGEPDAQKGIVGQVAGIQPVAKAALV